MWQYTHNIWYILIGVLMGVLLVGCNVTKFVPEDKQLLYKTKVVVEDNKKISTSKLSNYLRQKHNSEILGFWKLQLHIYNTAPIDTTTKSKKRLQKNAFAMGEAPEIYDPELTAISMDQLEKALQNMGYFNASVDTTVKVKNRKVRLTYKVKTREPYFIRDYNVNLPHVDLERFATGRGQQIKDGQQFDSELMDEERERVSNRMRADGYYYFEKNMLGFEADSSYGTNEVAVTMRLQDYVRDLPDSLKTALYSRYRIADVRFHLEQNLKIREPVLRRRCLIRKGEIYNERLLERTYSNLNSLGAVKYVDISFEDIGNNELVCNVTLSKAKMNSFSAEIEGTYSAGDWGVAGGVGFVNKNIFQGAEKLSVNGRVSYIWQQNGARALEGKADLGLEFPNNLKVKLAYDYQSRPDEYLRHIMSGGLYYTIRRPRSRWVHQFNCIDISYVYLPWMSDQFKVDFVDKSIALKYTYQNHFIMDWSYRISYNGQRQNQPERSYVTASFAVETAGNLLYGISRAVPLTPDTAGVYSIFKIPYSQYVKGDVNFTVHHAIAAKHQLVYHIGLGVAVPYLNASAVPFEKRYFSGGSNSVRGWQARTLGPGAYRNLTSGLAYDLQSGDVKLDLNIEYRWKVWSVIELAAFTDAGNIWTIRDYVAQPNGVFDFGQFYKQIAWSYGVGLRLDLSILVFRVDMGVKLYDPSRLNYDGKQWRTIPNGLGWKDDFTVHFAIGYPF